MQLSICKGYNIWNSSCDKKYSVVSIFLKKVVLFPRLVKNIIFSFKSQIVCHNLVSLTFAPQFIQFFSIKNHFHLLKEARREIFLLYYVKTLVQNFVGGFYKKILSYYGFHAAIQWMVETVLKTVKKLTSNLNFKPDNVSSSFILVLAQNWYIGAFNFFYFYTISIMVKRVRNGYFRMHICPSKLIHAWIICSPW